jgi:hypothetical protein
MCLEEECVGDLNAVVRANLPKKIAKKKKYKEMVFEISRCHSTRLLANHKPKKRN